MLGGVNLEGFSLAMPAALGTDLVQLDRLQTAAQASWQADRVDIEKASVDCDLCSASLVGTIPLGQKDGFSLSSLIRQRQELSGRLDLARLARMLPATLRLKQNMRIDSGQVQLTVTCGAGVSPAVQPGRPQQQGAVWHGQLDTTAAERHGRRTADRLAAADLGGAGRPRHAPRAGRGQPRLPVRFPRVRAAGTPDDFTAALNLSLNQLADRLGQFLNLDGVQLAGQGGGTVTWKRAQQQFDAGAQFRLDGFQWAMKDQAGLAQRRASRPRWRPRARPTWARRPASTPPR